ncbi:unnamed protein product, partial [Adineta steineri]
MAIKVIFFMQLILVLIFGGISESIGLCLNNDPSNSKVSFSITFGSGSATYSGKTPASSNFTTNFQQAFGPTISSDMFGFVNEIPNENVFSHTGAFDHTSNDKSGYMFFAIVNNENLRFFNYKTGNLCIGVRYQFSAYLANIFQKAFISGFALYVQFEVRAATITGPLLAQNITQGIFTFDSMIWSKQ